MKISKECMMLNIFNFENPTYNRIKIRDINFKMGLGMDEAIGFVCRFLFGDYINIHFTDLIQIILITLPLEQVEQ